MTDRTADLGAALERLLHASSKLPPEQLPVALGQTAAMLAATESQLLLADLEQRVLRHFARPDEPQRPDVDVGDPFAGRAFREERTVEEPTGGPGRRLWVPLMDSSERHGVLGVVDDGATPPAAWEAVGQLVGELVASKSAYGDVIPLLKRTGELTLSAEMRWALLPPLTYTAPDVVISGAMQPAHSIAGDAFDYAVNRRRAQVAVFDAMGHGLEASRIANVVIGSYRHARRRGESLPAVLRAMDAAVADQFGDAWFATVQVAELDLETGELEILNAGHPQPLLFRAGQPPRRIPVAPCRPVGLGTEPGAPHVEQLEEGDVVVFHTDGISEARSSSGEPFGEDRLAADLDRLFGDGHRPAEVLRLLIHDVLAYQDGPARDDASLVLLGWRHSHSMVPGGLDVTS